MSKQPLARLVDREALEKEGGRIGRIELDVPRTWLEEGSSLEVDVARRVQCGRCDGGGCDGCGRSGAHRIESGSREVSLHVPSNQSAALRIRLAQPFDCNTLAQLWVDLRGAENASANVRRTSNLPADMTKEPLRLEDVLPWAVMLLALLAMAIWAAL
jgi:hypothetical protein